MPYIGARLSWTPARLFDPQAAATFLSYLALSILIFGRGLLLIPRQAISAAALTHWRTSGFSDGGPTPLHTILTLSRLSQFGRRRVSTLPGPRPSRWQLSLLSGYAALGGNRRLQCRASDRLAVSGMVRVRVCRYVVYRFWPAWFGGCLFAFSPYMLTAMIGGGLFMLVFSVPLGVWATLRRLAAKWKREAS